MDSCNVWVHEIRLSKGGIHLILCLTLLCVLKTAISVVGLVPAILYFTDQVWAYDVLDRFVRALRWVQGT